MKIQGIIFDLDGVICFTDEYHYRAWKKMADRHGLYFDRQINKEMLGLSRMDSLEVILRHNRKADGCSDTQKAAMAEEKNAYYRESLKDMSASDLSPEVKASLDTLRARGFLLGIGSSSKNTPFILERLGLGDYFDAVSDGNNITHAKPDPEVFCKAAQFLGLSPAACVVVEDAVSGARAGHAGGFTVACLGAASHAGAGDYNLEHFRELPDLPMLQEPGRRDAGQPRQSA